MSFETELWKDKLFKGCIIFAVILIIYTVGGYILAFGEEYVGDLRFNNDGTKLFLYGDDGMIDEIDLKEPFNVESIKIQYSMKYISDNGEYKVEPITKINIVSEQVANYRTDSHYVFPINTERKIHTQDEILKMADEIQFELFEELRNENEKRLDLESLLELWKENIPYNLITVIFWIGLAIFILLYLSRKMKESEVLN